MNYVRLSGSTPTDRRQARPETTIHMAGLFGGSSKRRTWCGRLVGDDQLPIIGTRREVNCKACARSLVAKQHAILWNYNYRTRWQRVLQEEPA